MAVPESSGTVRIEGLTKRFGDVLAVDDLSFTVEPGRITGFLGPNGAGKSTTLRVLLGLVAPTAGRATVGVLRYADLARPSATIGASLEASGFHPRRTGRDHLVSLCDLAGIPRGRADEALETVDLSWAGRRRAGTYSLGMRQRLALAAALLGEPPVLVLDEPTNGLDPEGTAWLRRFLADHARSGGTVLVSSHVLAEVVQTVDDVVIVARGRLVRRSSLADLMSTRSVRVSAPESARLRDAVHGDGVEIRSAGPDTLLVTGLQPSDISRIAFRERLELTGIGYEDSSLERLFLDLTRDEEQV